MKEILPRVLLNKEGDSALCLKASGSNSSAGLYRATKADDHWATRQAQLTADRARFHRALCGLNRMKNSSHLYHGVSVSWVFKFVVWCGAGHRQKVVEECLTIRKQSGHSLQKG